MCPLLLRRGIPVYLDPMHYERLACGVCSLGSSLFFVSAAPNTMFVSVELQGRRSTAPDVMFVSVELDKSVSVAPGFRKDWTSWWIGILGE